MYPPRGFWRWKSLKLKMRNPNQRRGKRDVGD